MSDVEAASSLFGSTDEGIDPFAAATNEEQEPAQDPLVDDSSNLFVPRAPELSKAPSSQSWYTAESCGNPHEGAPLMDNIVPENGPESRQEEQDWYNDEYQVTDSYGQAQNGYSADNFAYEAESDPYNPTSYVTEGTSVATAGEEVMNTFNGSAPSYEPSVYSGDSSSSANTYTPQTSSYASQTTSAYVPETSSAYLPQTSGTYEPKFDPYAPPQHQPYAGVVSAPAAIDGLPLLAPQEQFTPSVPPPPRPTAPPVRPVSYNAYDPPLPTKKAVTRSTYQHASPGFPTTVPDTRTMSLPPQNPGAPPRRSVNSPSNVFSVENVEARWTSPPPFAPGTSVEGHQPLPSASGYTGVSSARPPSLPRSGVEEFQQLATDSPGYSGSNSSYDPSAQASAEDVSTTDPSFRSASPAKPLSPPAARSFSPLSRGTPPPQTSSPNSLVYAQSEGQDPYRPSSTSGVPPPPPNRTVKSRSTSPVVERVSGANGHGRSMSPMGLMGPSLHDRIEGGEPQRPIEPQYSLVSTRRSPPLATGPFRERSSTELSAPEKSSYYSPYDKPASQVSRSPERPMNGFAQRQPSIDSSTDMHGAITKSPDFNGFPRYGSPDLMSNVGQSHASSASFTSNASYDPYMPSTSSTRSAFPQRSMTNSSMASTASHDLAPPHYQAPAFGAQEVTVLPSQGLGAYAPSPSLLGLNDPLQRAKVKVPVVSFGFGGKLVTCFHTSSTMGGFDIAMTSRQARDVHIQTLNKVLPVSALDVHSEAYPGPLYGEATSQIPTMVLSTATNNAKAKKVKVLKYLEERSEEFSRGLGYTAADSAEHRKTEGKLTLVNVLRCMLEYDGQLTGSPQIDAAVRKALLPNAHHLDAQDESEAFTVPAASGSFGHPAYPSVHHSPTQSRSSIIAQPSQLDRIQAFLLRGEKRQAFHYAMDEKLWTHAMIIASSVDKEAFQEAVNEFIREELAVKDDSKFGQTLNTRPDGSHGPLTNGRESLRVAYGLFSGQAAASLQHLIPQKLIAGVGAMNVPVTNALTPLTPNFPSLTLASHASPEVFANWQETAAMILAGQMGPETAAALMTLGDYLMANQWVEASQACYLLSQSSQIGGLLTPGARITLLGCQNPQQASGSSKDPDCVVFTEILEYALSLRAPVKGQDAFHGLPHLQPYKLLRAEQLAELGYVALAKKYCDAIASCANRPSPYYTPVFVEGLKALSDRLTGGSESDKSNGWMGGRISKPSLDIGGWITRMTLGDETPETPGNPAFPTSQPYSGAFSTYSAISQNPSTSPSPVPSFTNLQMTSSSLPVRTGSSMGLRPYSPHLIMDRSSSAMDHRAQDRRASPVQRILSADAATTSFSQAQSFSQALSNGSADHSSQSFSQADAPSSETTMSQEDVSNESGSWWNGLSSSGASATPKATTFFQVDAAESANGFISPMSNYTPPVPAPSHSNGPSASELDDDDDLGLGNSSRAKQKQNSNDDSAEQPTNETQEKPAEPPKKPDPQPTGSSSGSWFGKWFNRGSTPGPVKASLGEETTFYYDKELKKWVNKKAGNDNKTPAPPPPPPPARAQTASPGRALGGPANTPPPARPASAFDGPPQKAPPRARSNLVPIDVEGPTPPTLTPTPSPGLNGEPPFGRPRSSAAKRNVRSRYVDVFQQASS